MLVTVYKTKFISRKALIKFICFLIYALTFAIMIFSKAHDMSKFQIGIKTWHITFSSVSESSHTHGKFDKQLL